MNMRNYSTLQFARVVSNGSILKIKNKPLNYDIFKVAVGTLRFSWYKQLI
jgi:hypothetical protein